MEKKKDDASAFGLGLGSAFGGPLPAAAAVSSGGGAALLGGVIGGAIGAAVMSHVPKSKRGEPLSLTLSPQARAGLDALVTTGLFGKTPEEAAERLLMERMRDLVTDGWIELVPAAPAPAARGRRRRGRR